MRLIKVEYLDNEINIVFNSHHTLYDKWMIDLKEHIAKYKSKVTKRPSPFGLSVYLWGVGYDVIDPVNSVATIKA